MATTKSSGSGPAKKSAKKSGTKSATKSQQPSRKTSKKTSQSSAGSSRSRSKSAAPRAESGKKKSGMSIAAEAARQLLELTGREVEGIVGLERSDDGWKVQVEVVEVRRIPDTTDILALYELTTDADGELEGYRRVRRYGRGVPGEESER